MLNCLYQNLQQLGTLPDVADSQAQVGNATCAISFHENILTLDVSMGYGRFTCNIHQMNDTVIISNSSMHHCEDHPGEPVHER